MKEEHSKRQEKDKPFIMNQEDLERLENWQKVALWIGAGLALLVGIALLVVFPVSGAITFGVITPALASIIGAGTVTVGVGVSLTAAAGVGFILGSGILASIAVINHYTRETTIDIRAVYNRLTTTKQDEMRKDFAALAYIFGRACSLLNIKADTTIPIRPEYFNPNNLLYHFSNDYPSYGDQAVINMHRLMSFMDNLVTISDTSINPNIKYYPLSMYYYATPDQQKTVEMVKEGGFIKIRLVTNGRVDTEMMFPVLALGLAIKASLLNQKLSKLKSKDESEPLYTFTTIPARPTVENPTTDADKSKALLSQRYLFADRAADEFTSDPIETLVYMDVTEPDTSGPGQTPKTNRLLMGLDTNNNVKEPMLIIDTDGFALKHVVSAFQLTEELLKKLNPTITAAQWENLNEQSIKLGMNVTAKNASTLVRPYPIIPPGDFHIMPKINKKKAIENLDDFTNNTVQLYDYEFGRSNQWEIVYDEDTKLYSFWNFKNGNVLTYVGNNQPVEERHSEYNGDHLIDTQCWNIINKNNEYCAISSHANNNQFLTLPNGATANATKIYAQNEQENPDNQTWLLRPAISMDTRPSAGTYKIDAFVKPEKSINALYDPYGTSGHMYVADPQYNNLYKFDFIYDESKAGYKIRIHGHSTLTYSTLTYQGPNQQVTLELETNSDAQYWKIKTTMLDDRLCFIISSYSNPEQVLYANQSVTIGSGSIIKTRQYSDDHNEYWVLSPIEGNVAHPDNRIVLTGNANTMQAVMGLQHDAPQLFAFTHTVPTTQEGEKAASTFTCNLYEGATGGNKVTASFTNDKDIVDFTRTLHRVSCSKGDILQVVHTSGSCDVYTNGEKTAYDGELTHHFIIAENELVKVFDLPTWVEDKSGYYIDGLTISKVPTGKKIKYKVLLNGDHIGTSLPSKSDGKGADEILFTPDYYDIESWGIYKLGNTITVIAIDPDTKFEYQIAQYTPK
jgi:hypothetical protein